MDGKAGSGAVPDQSPESGKACRMGFKLTNVRPKRLLMSYPGCHGAVGRLRGSTIFSIMAPDLGWKLMPRLDSLKRATISRLHGIPPVGLGLERVIEVATKSSLESGEPALAGAMAYLVAHDIAGAGPFSMLLDRRCGVEALYTDPGSMRVRLRHSDYGLCETNLAFRSRAEMESAALRASGLGGWPGVKGLRVDVAFDYRKAGIIRAGLDRRVRYAVAELRKDREAAGVRALGSGYDSACALAYLWMAMDIGMNIVICGGSAAERRAALERLYDFVPRSCRVAVSGVKKEEADCRDGFVYFGSPGGSGAAGMARPGKEIKSLLAARPDRLFASEPSAQDTVDIFSGVIYGTPFVLTMESGRLAPAAGFTWLGKAKLENWMVGFLDIIVSLGRAGGPSSGALDAVEYSWLCRGATATGLDDNPYQFASKCIKLDHSINAQSLSGSSVLMRYSSSSAISIKSSIREFNRRLRFISGALRRGSDKAEMAGWIVRELGHSASAERRWNHRLP